MIRGIIRFFINLFSCRLKMTSLSMTVVILMFLGGNYLILRSLFHGNSKVNTKTVGIHQVNRNSGFLQNNNNNIKTNNNNNNEDKFIGDNHGNIDVIKTKLSPHMKEPKLTITNEPSPHEVIGEDINGHKDSKRKFKIALLVISCNRIEVRRCLDKIFKYKPEDYPIQVVVSQDCGHAQTAEVIRSYGDKIKFIQQPDLGPVQGVPGNMHRFMGYYKISRHFKFALSQVFETTDSDSVIIVEDDIDIAPDFFDYFLATRKLLEADDTLYCVSAWNDNGKENSIDPKAIDLLYRSDFFPGLGWMMTRKLWNEIGASWPKGFWDDWMRAPEQRKSRSCIRPEISRTKTFGRIGVSQGQFYDQYLKYIKLNSEPYPFQDYDLSYLTKSQYDQKFLDTVYAIREISSAYEASKSGQEDVRLTYRNNYEFESHARHFGLMTDFKAGVPRTAYNGVVTVYKEGHRIYIAPPQGWKGYSER